MSSGNSPKSPLSVRLAVTVAGIAAVVGDGSVLGVAQVLGHLDFQGALDQHFGQLLEQTVLADQVFWLLVVDQQASASLISSGAGWARLVRGSTVILFLLLKATVSWLMAVYTKFLTPS